MASQPLTSVLVVDDDPIVCAIAESYFRDAGSDQVSVANNGQEAIDAIDRHGAPFDLILLDLKMPVMDGVQFLRHMSERAYPGAIGLISGENGATLSLARELATKQGLSLIGQAAKPIDNECLDELLSARITIRNEQSTPGSSAIALSEFEQALLGDEIEAYYQPQCDARTGRMVGIEALARWNHPDRGILGPGHFVPMAENHGLMSELTWRMVDNVICDSNRPGLADFKLKTSINLGAEVLGDRSFPDKLAEKIQHAGCSQDQMVLELTESRLVEDSIEALEVLARLDLLGFELSIDDFGTQFSNFEQLTKFPFKELKIDQRFAGSASTDQRALSTVQSCVSIAQKLNMRTVAEGIETDEDWRCMIELGVDVIQGFRIAKPMPANSMASWLHTLRDPQAHPQLVSRG